MMFPVLIINEIRSVKKKQTTNIKKKNKGKLFGRFRFFFETFCFNDVDFKL